MTSDPSTSHESIKRLPWTPPTLLKNIGNTTAPEGKSYRPTEVTYVPPVAPYTIRQGPS